MHTALEIAQLAIRIYAETHPRPPHVSQRQAAEMLDVSPPTVAKYIRAGKLRLNGTGLIPTWMVDELLRTNYE